MRPSSLVGHKCSQILQHALATIQPTAQEQTQLRLRSLPAAAHPSYIALSSTLRRFHTRLGFGAGFDLTASIEDLAPGTPKKIQISNALSCIDPGQSWASKRVGFRAYSHLASRTHRLERGSEFTSVGNSRSRLRSGKLMMERYWPFRDIIRRSTQIPVSTPGRSSPVFHPREATGLLGNVTSDDPIR